MIVQNWWFTTLLDKKYTLCPPLQEHIKCDVLIIGGGMSGISAAARFIGKGLKVVLLEKNIVGGSSTGKSAGFLTPDSELELSQLVRRFGINGAKEVWEVPVKGIELIKNNVEKYKIECDFRTQDSLFLGIGKTGEDDVKEELKSRQEVGFDNQEIFSKKELSKILNSNNFNGAIRYDKTYGINPLQYVQGMKEILLQNDIQIFESTEVLSIHNQKAICHAGSVKADQIIVSIDKMDSKFSHFADNIFHAQTFLSVSEPLSNEEINNLFPSKKEFQMWDNSLVYSYWRLIEGNRILLGGGSALTTFLPNAWYHEDVIQGVHKKFKSHFPFLKNIKFIQYWPGLIDTSKDLLPIITKDEYNPNIHFIGGVVGLPWASFCGDFVARNILNEAEYDNEKYYEYFSIRRPFAFPNIFGKFFGKPILFAANNGWAKYYQVDKNSILSKKDNEF